MRKNDKLVGIYRYFYLNKEKNIFSNLTQLKYDSVDDYLTYIRDHNIAVRTYNEKYLMHRFNTEKAMYDQFVHKGGKPCIKHPYYFTLGKCDEWFYGKKGAFGSVELLLEEFNPDVISFTYGDSIPTFMEEFQDGKEYRGQIYTLAEIQDLIDKYGLPNIWNTFGELGPENYIEVQVWSSEFISTLTSKKTKFENISVSELADRMIRANNNVYQNPIEQKSSDYYIKKCKSHKKWSWFCELIKRVPFDTFCFDYIHGISHAHKCALMAFIIANELRLNDVDFNTLIYAAFFHDVGRKCFDNGKKHGIISSEKIELLKDDFDEVHLEQLKDALAKHDDRALIVDNDNPFLIWLRDIDSLDYLRLGMGKYTTKYLRTNIAKSLVKCAMELNILMYLDVRFIFKLTEEMEL